MLIIPLTGKLSKDNLPLATMIIILMNVVIYFAIQYPDSRHYEDAQKFYFQSGLADIELKYYQAYQEGRPQPEKNEIKNTQERPQKQFREMMGDETFQNDLTNSKIITPQDPQFQKWRELRDQYELTIQRSTAWQYGFIPKKHEPMTVLSHLFLHGYFMHLLGNMVFLWLVGCILELGFGRINYIILYLLGGVFAAGLFYVFNINSTVPLVGASGAISGLMGAYTVAYGKTKINVFYSLGFYFNYTRVYAIVLLPMWLVSELLQLIFMTGSRVAYLAHIGGLTAGAALGFANMTLFKKEEHKVFAEDPKEDIKPLLEDALTKMENLDMTKARSVLLKVLDLEPTNEDATKHLYTIDKLHPNLPEFHQTAAKRLTALCRRRGSEKLLTETFTDYCRHAGKPQLNSDLLLNISRAFALLDKIDESEALIGYVFAMTPNHPRLAAMWMETAKICHQMGRHELRDHCTGIVLKHFPYSPEAVAMQTQK